MNIKKLNSIGWIVAAGLLGVTLASGFQNATEKTATVDFNRLALQSELGKANSAALNQQAAARDNLLKFLDTYRTLNIEQAQRLRDIWLKTGATPAETAELEKLKKDAQDSAKTRDDLSQKQQLTDADRALLQDLNSRGQALNALLQRWGDEFNTELGKLQQTLRDATVEKAKAALNDVAKSQGYTLVFETSVAPYSANDLTDAAIKAMNAKK